MQENTNWYWKQQPLQHTIMVPKRTILHPRLDVIIIRYVQDIPQEPRKKEIQRHPIIMNGSGYDYILDEIDRREKLF